MLGVIHSAWRAEAFELDILGGQGAAAFAQGLDSLFELLAGFDFGGDGARTMMLVYNLDRTGNLFQRFAGIDGSAYFIGGVGVNFQRHDDVILAPIRTGVGARLGANVGYLKYSKRPNWNPF